MTGIFWIFVHFRTANGNFVYFRTANGNLELDFNSDPADIRNPDTHVMDYSTINRMQSESKPKYRVSLRVCISLCAVFYFVVSIGKSKYSSRNSMMGSWLTVIYNNQCLYTNKSSR